MAAEKTVNKWLITLTVMLPAIMEIVDTSVANVALPHMQGSLNAGTDEITWVLTSYLVSNAVVLPMTGWLARMFGRKRFLITCITLFTMASFLCGAAPSLGLLIFFRVLQGAAGGALIPMSQAIMMETFPPYQQGMAMAIFGVGAMFGPIIGPALGGWITDNMTWRWIFYINIPIGIVAVIMATFFIYDPSYLKRARTSIDYWGLSLLVVGLGALQIVLDKGQQEDWFNSPFILVFSAVSAIALLCLVYVELTHPHPIVNLRLFKNVSFSAGNLIMFAVGFCLYSSIMLIPLFLQTLMGYNATMAGMVLAPGGVATLVCMPFVGAIIQRYDGRKVVLMGLLVGACSMFIMQRFSLDAAYADFVWPRIVLGVGLAMTFVPLTTVTLSTIAKEEMGNATGIFSLLRNIGGSVGIAISATLLARYSQFYQTNLAAQVTPYSLIVQSRINQLKQATMMRGVDPITAEKSAYAIIYGTVRKHAAMLSYNRIFFIVGIAFLIIIPLLLLLKKPVRHVRPAAH
ncbi:EmrB/QacA family drug resistance transporter [Geomonas limicola]|uniref:EmrB/QacA family drug resistance transporter n=1 Tax=Geomonas limicola TaxID=2740186 RepID=A0A6V8N565_9BACT|nr:DHA2 family efflux MFS transporter permease subunit [Geomonas limicola]GFO66763.1 EmrB/QacA family drug resistance transporter [Geomonas limicola]